MRTYAILLTAAFAVSASSLISAANAASLDRSPFAPSVSSGSCVISKTEYAAADSFDESTSTNFVNLGDAGSITFKQVRTGCVGGTFFANAGNVNTGDEVVMQILLDGTACAPLTSDYIFANSGTDFSSHSVAFFCGSSVVPGSHTIQVEYHSFLGGNVEFFQRSLEVAHR